MKRLPVVGDVIKLKGGTIKMTVIEVYPNSPSSYQYMTVSYENPITGQIETKDLIRNVYSYQIEKEVISEK